jgi:uncharacterized membrane protein
MNWHQGGIVMKLKTLFIIHAIIAFFFGLAFVFAPAATLAPYSATTNETGLDLARLLGAAYLGFSMVAWFARNTDESAARQAIVLGFFLGSIFGCVASLYNQINGITNALGWLNVGIYLLLALAYGYFQFAKPGAS